MREGWKLKKLSEICTFINGKAYSKQELLETGKYPVLRVGNFFTSNHWYYSDLELPEEKYCENGDLLYAWSASFGPRIWEGEKVIYHYHIWKVEPDCELITKEFLFLFLLWDVDKIKKDHGTGSTMMHVGKGSMDERKILLPPIDDQKFITNLLYQAFTAIAIAKANAEKNLKNARELFESYLQDFFKNKIGGWEEKPLKDITLKIGSGATPRGGNGNYKVEGISLIRSMNVHDLAFKERNLAFIDDKQAQELNNAALQEDDILLNITGASVARCCMIPKSYLPARVNQHVSIIRAKKEIIDPVFLTLLLTSKYYKNQLLSTGEQGATRQAITKGQLEVFKVSFPQLLLDQIVVVQKVNALSKQTKKIEAIYTKKIADLEELKKSLLQKAFNGELKTDILEEVIN